MKKSKNNSLSRNEIILGCIYSPLIILQFILFFFFYYNHYGLDLLTYLGWFIWALSIIFGFLPIYTFHKLGGVSKGKSYVNTTKLVDTGVYSIVRHPQYLAGLLLITALALLSQHWLSVTAGIFAFIALYLDTSNADPKLIQKFGNDYRKYMERVPRLNFIQGIIKKLLRKNDEAIHNFFIIYLFCSFLILNSEIYIW